MWKTGTAQNYIDLLDALDAYITLTGSTHGLEYAGTGDGTITLLSGGPSSIAESWVIEATSATEFTVTGSVSGLVGTATVGTVFTDNKITFLITAGATPFVSGDTWTCSTAPKWTQLRMAKGAHLLASKGNTGQYAVQNLVDGKTASDYARNWIISNGEQNEWIELVFHENETFAEWAVRATDNGASLSMTLQYWDGADWANLDVRTGLVWAPGELKSFSIASPHAASHYRVLLDAGGGGFVTGLAALEMRRSVGGWNAAYGQAIWKAPGNDGDSEIYVGIHPFMRPDVDYYDWELASFDAYNASVGFMQQAGFHGRNYIPLWNDDIPYWFVVNGRRVIVIAKLGSQYEPGYLGFYDPYFSPEQLPYPMMLGGCLAMDDSSPPIYWNSADWRYSNSSYQHSGFPHSDPRNTTWSIYAFQLRVRRLDGEWAGFMGEVGGSRNLGTAPTSSQNIIWPYISGMSLLDSNLDGGACLIPILLNHGAPNTLGQLDGVCAVSGQGLNPETLLRLGAVDWMVVQNIFRTDRDDFFALRLD